MVVQRVSRASVEVDGDIVGAIARGLVVLVGVEPEDGSPEVKAGVDKLLGLRLFADELGKMNLDIGSVAGEILVVSQFTLLADARKGRRPSFTAAARPEDASHIICQFVNGLQEAGLTVAQGSFGANMSVQLTNDGPVTLVLDFKEGRLV